MNYNIIGCGVIGLTTGICLNALGYNTTIIAEKIPEYEDYINKSDNKIATEYAAASVKPSTIDHKNKKNYINKLLSNSINIFEIFTEINSVNYITHYIGGDKYKNPYYSEIVKNYTKDTDLSPGSVQKDSKFDCLFIDMPEYIRKLLRLYKKTGGEIINRKVKSIDSIENPINCAGLGSKDLIGDNKMRGIKGYLGYVETGFRIKKDDNIVSYAYNIDNKSVYAYPQKNRIVLGGTALDNENKNISYYNTKIESIPEHIIRENRRIIKDYFNIDILNYNIYGVSGYRPYRIGGPRIEQNNECIHNYGHGGCGVTLSWGSAFEICKTIDQRNSIMKDIKYDIKSNI